MAIHTRKAKPRGRPFRKGGPGGPGRKPGIPNKATQDIKERAREVLEDPAYLASLKARLETGEAGQVEALLFHYGYGKPRETVAIEGGTTPLPLVVKLTE